MTTKVVSSAHRSTRRLGLRATPEQEAMLRRAAEVMSGREWLLPFFLAKRRMISVFNVFNVFNVFIGLTMDGKVGALVNGAQSANFGGINDDGTVSMAIFFGDLSSEDVTIGHVSLTVLSLRASGARLARPPVAP